MISLAPISKILDIDCTGKSMICCYLFYCCVKNNATINSHIQTFVWGFCTYIWVTCNVLNKGQTHIMGTSGGEELLGGGISMKLVYWDLHVITPLCSLSGGNLTATEAKALARALQENNSLKELKWVVNWVLSGTVRVEHYVPLAVVGKIFPSCILPPGNCNVHYQVLCHQNITC